MSLPVILGRVAFVFSEANFDVDRLIGFDAMREHDADTLAQVVMRSFDPEFGAKVGPGDVLVGGVNFGYGHPHGPPMAAMRRLGVAAVIAESFAPLYLIGEIAAGFAQITCPGIVSAVERWDKIAVDWSGGRVRNHTRGVDLPFVPLSDNQADMIQAGGLVNLLRREVFRA